MNRTVDALIVPYARRRTLELVLSLSGYEADKDAYLEAKGVLERAIAALDDGRDPADNIERISTGCPMQAARKNKQSNAAKENCLI